MLYQTEYISELKLNGSTKSDVVRLAVLSSIYIKNSVAHENVSEKSVYLTNIAFYSLIEYANTA